MFSLLSTLKKLKTFTIYNQLRALLCTCIACDAKPPVMNSFLCGGCCHLIPDWRMPRCRGCGLYIAKENATLQTCGACLKKPRAFDRVYAVFPFEFPINHFIYELKSHGRLIFADFFAAYFIKYFSDWYANDCIPDILIPMPLHRRRLAERGFNQAGEITKIVAKGLSIPCELSCMQRIIYTKTQRYLNKMSRSRNVRGVFSLSKPLSAKHYVVIDDVLASGHTAASLACTLKSAGAQRVDLWCCARAMA